MHDLPIWEDGRWKKFWAYVNSRDDVDHGYISDVLTEVIVKHDLVDEVIAEIKSRFPEDAA